MEILLSDSPQPPYPQPPLPQQPQTSQVRAPMVYVYEKQAWEYKIIAKDAGTEELLTEQDLNALGSSGWELTAVATVAGEVQFYFKRARE
jgi:hypothetical protein